MTLCVGPTDHIGRSPYLGSDRPLDWEPTAGDSPLGLRRRAVLQPALAELQALGAKPAAAVFAWKLRERGVKGCEVVRRPSA
jgi:hypothetical protein